MAFLELSHVTKLFGQFNAVEDFNLQIERGELVSFLGPSGCGKTTTLRMIAGFESPSAGTVTLNGNDVTPIPPNRRNIGMVFQAYALFPNMTVADNIGFGMGIARKPKREIETRVEELLRLIHMPGLGDRYPSQLSGGQQQRVALARALAIQPQALLLDEPLSALDAKIRVQLRQEIRSIQQSLHITTVYVTHDQEEALSLSDRVVVMNEGRIEQAGTPFEIYNFPATRFVAQFVGTLNTLSAQVRDPATGRLAIDSQEFETVQSLEGLAAGQAVSVSLRPERISVYSEAQKANVLEGRLENISFLGSIVRMHIRIGDGALVADTFNNPFLELPKIGQAIKVSFSKEAVLVLRGSAAPKEGK